MRLFCSTLLITLLAVSAAAQAEWPQILGPSRDGVAPATERLALWPATRPRVVWRAPAGEGYSGPAVADGRVLLFDRQGQEERLVALEATTGKPLWRTSFAASYRGTFNPDSGPRAVPVVHEGSVYVYGAAGDLHRVNLADGKKVWTRELRADYDADDGYFGAGSTPLVMGDRLLVNIGGKPGASIVALSLKSGETLWRSFDDEASYASPTTITLGVQRQALFVTRLHTVVVDPQNGQTLARFPFGKRGPTVNAAVPLVSGAQVFVTASYGVGAKLVELAGREPRIVWENDDSLSSQYNTPVLHAGHLYGIHGREDVGVAEFRCVELATGRVLWSQRDFGCAHAILVGDRILLTTIDGRLLLIEASPRGFRSLAEATLTRDTVRALPALSEGRLFVRSEKELICVEVGQPGTRSE